ncbi:MAG: alpha/beta hydrolase [Deltaproteobacteria bacterium]|nr:MAG: alpha/beta hydrolase [Deltaproteobacteria bacterium]
MWVKGFELSLMDRPEVSSFIFYPRRDPPPTKNTSLCSIEVEEGVFIVCRFYPAAKEAPTILYFHGNGETAGDYDLISSLYSSRGINLFVADYRGYGLSTGEPSMSHILGDAHPIFQEFKKVLQKGGYLEAIFVMGRSLGSVPAIEVAFHYQDELKGLIVESGFSDAFRLLSYIGLPLEGLPTEQGRFPNGDKMCSIHLPTLLIHAAEDRLIPLREAEELFRLCAAEQKDLVVIPRADHNNLMMVARERYFQAIEEFIRRHL